MAVPLEAIARLESVLNHHATVINQIHRDVQILIRKTDEQRDEMISWHETLLKHKVVFKGMYEKVADRMAFVKSLAAEVAQLNAHNEKLQAQNDEIRDEFANLQIVMPALSTVDEATMVDSFFVGPPPQEMCAVQTD